MPRTYVAKDHAGVKYGKLTGVRFVKLGSSRNRVWLFRCDCGRERTAVAGHVTANKITSCGCGDAPIASRVAKLKQLYKFNDKEAHSWLLKTEGNCDICGLRESVVQSGKPKPLSIDHCHKNKTVRGLLCSRCNIMLGYYEKHPAFPSRIECFDKYLNRWPWET